MELACIHFQYDRLQRHHQMVLAGGDEIAFLDLVHVLRIWVELKALVTAIAKAHGISLGLPHHAPPKFIKRSLQGAIHISMPLASSREGRSRLRARGGPGCCSANSQGEASGDPLRSLAIWPHRATGASSRLPGW